MFAWVKVIHSKGQPQPLAPQALTGRVWVRAKSDNTGVVYVGGAPHQDLGDNQTVGGEPDAATFKGYPLDPGDRLPFPVPANECWVDGEDDDVVSLVML